MSERLPLTHAGYALYAPGPGRTVVLLHGASGCAATWLPVLPAWSWADTWALDLPGRAHGQPLDSVPALAAWLRRVIDAAGWQQPLIVGHSLGGGVALQLALDAPRGLGGIVLVASAARLRVAPPILDAVAALQPGEPLAMDFAFGPGTDPAVVRDYAERTRDVPPAAALADWRACDRFDVRERLDQVPVPTLVVFGSEDLLTPPRYQRPLAAAVALGSYTEVSGAGHMLPWEAPADLSHAVRRWAGA